MNFSIKLIIVKVRIHLFIWVKILLLISENIYWFSSARPFSHLFKFIFRELIPFHFSFLEISENYIDIYNYIHYRISGFQINFKKMAHENKLFSLINLFFIFLTKFMSFIFMRDLTRVYTKFCFLLWFPHHYICISTWWAANVYFSPCTV